MLITLRNDRKAMLKPLNTEDIDALVRYLQNLSTETKQRFAPHAFEKEAIIDFYSNRAMRGYIAKDPMYGEIVAYTIIKIGYLDHDKPRLESYYLRLDSQTDSTFAPSVADAWQSSGLGSAFLLWIIEHLKAIGVKRIILWGGVQKDNAMAVHFYQKNGFLILGQFVYHGENYDMLKEII